MNSHLSVYMWDCCCKLQPVQQVVPIVIVHFEIVQLELLGRHVFLWFVYDALQMLHDVAATRGTTNKHSYWLDRTQSSPRPESCTAMPLTLCLEPCFYPGDVGWLHFLRSAAAGGGGGDLGSSERECTENSRTKRGAYPPTAHYTCCSSFCCGKPKTDSQQVQEHSSWISMLDITFLLLKCPQFSTSLT